VLKKFLSLLIVLHSSLTLAAAPEWVDPDIVDASQAQYNLDSQENFVAPVVRSIMSNMHTSRYHLGSNQFNLEDGTYQVDCSAYVNHVLEHSAPQAYNSLQAQTGTNRPSTSDYFHFLAKIPAEQATHNWMKVAQVDELQPGDLIVYRKNAVVKVKTVHKIKQVRHGHKKIRRVVHTKIIHQNSGHIMVVMSKPIPDANLPNVYHLEVSDSASSGHGHDTRGHSGGIGMGTVLIKVSESTLAPVTLSWQEVSRWQPHIMFEMGRPLA
jgi:hypothetical protein